MMEYLYASDYSTTDTAPTFSLDTHTAVFALASTLFIPGLQTLSIAKYRHNLNTLVSDLSVYFASVRAVYALTTSSNPGLRLAVVEAAICEMRNLLAEGTAVRDGFLALTSEVGQFQADIYALLLRNPTRPLEVLAQELCEECGPREEGDGYEVTTECKGCGKERTLEFY
jgi:hypothetical protein